MFKVLDLFSGIGGFSLGLERTGGFETVGFCEIDLTCRALLSKHWPRVTIHADIRKLSVVPSDVVCGGFPCQPFSTASHGRKVAEDLWPEMLRVVRQSLPTWVIAENVLPQPINKAKLDLENLGYDVWEKRIGAHDAGADHKRNRWWLCAYANNKSEFRGSIDAEVAKLPELCSGIWGAENYARAIRVSNGLPHRMDRLRQLGNAVVPQIPEAIGRGILRFTNSHIC